MTTFHFRLERLLRLRSLEETEQAKRLGSALSSEEAARSIVERAEAHMERCRDQLTPREDAPTPAGLMNSLRNTIQSAAHGLEAAERLHAVKREARNVEETAYSEARKERRVLERLSDRALVEWRRDTNRQDQKQTDAVAEQRWRLKEGS